MDGWNTKCLLLGQKAYFQVLLLLVSRSVTEILWNKLYKLGPIPIESVDPPDHSKIWPYIIFNSISWQNLQNLGANWLKHQTCHLFPPTRRAEKNMSSPCANHAPNCGNLCVVLRSADPLSKRKNWNRRENPVGQMLGLRPQQMET